MASTPSILYHCQCLSNLGLNPPPPHLPSSAHSFHAFENVYFCEECNSVRCNNCVTVEVSGYYCPNCLFEVPSASVRAEKNRCARNCFLCPICRNTLSVVPSDPPDEDDGMPGVISPIGEPPFFLYCNYCRWDSASLNITFEKPTGLAAQLQRHEDTLPETLEFERLKEHFEPFIRNALSGTTLASSTTPSHSHHASHLNSLTAAAAAALARDVPGVGRYHPSKGARKDRTPNKDDMPEYRSRIDVAHASTSPTGGAGGETDVELVRRLESIGEIATLEQRWDNSWANPLQTSELRPIRIPLQAKRTKRCPVCTHILIKPEQKAQSVKYKILLVSSAYLPYLRITLPHQIAETMRRPPPTRAGQQQQQDAPPTGMHAGRTYPFYILVSNPLDEPMQVRLSVQRVHVAASAPGEKVRRPPFAISLPTSPFTITAYQDVDDSWANGEDDMDGEEYNDYTRRRAALENRNVKAVGVLERRANTVMVGGEVVIGKEARDNIRFNMLVQFTYHDVSQAANDDSASKKEHKSETKTFPLYTVVDLGAIIPKEEIVPMDEIP